MRTPLSRTQIHRLPVFVALKRALGPGIVNLAVLEVPVVAQNKLVVAQLVLDARGIDASLPARVSKHDDEWVVVGVFQRTPGNKGERCHR